MEGKGKGGNVEACYSSVAGGQAGGRMYVRLFTVAGIVMYTEETPIPSPREDALESTRGMYVCVCVCVSGTWPNTEDCT